MSVISAPNFHVDSTWTDPYLGRAGGGTIRPIRVISVHGRVVGPRGPASGFPSFAHLLVWNGLGSDACQFPEDDKTLNHWYNLNDDAITGPKGILSRRTRLICCTLSLIHEEPNERVNSLRISQELSRLAPSERDWGQTRVETNAERELRSVENHEMQN